MGFLEIRDLSNVPTIPQFYRGKTIFMTGGSGFIGKILIEKLLYSCKVLDRIYLLLREKKNVKSEDRLAELYASPCYDRLKTERPGLFESKVFVVSGDVMEPGLGLSEEDRALLVNRVNVIFHVAASVRFDDTLMFAVKMNLKGTVEMIELAKEMRNLVAFVHVSTSYSNTNRDPVEEVMYPPHADWRDTLAICENLDPQTIKVFTPKYLGEIPNTYTFTKQLAEHVVYEHRGQLPIVIIRPSIVIATMDEPFPGWIENFNGPVGLMVAGGKGILRSIFSSPDIKCDYIPVDICTKHIAAAAWIRGTKKLEPGDDIPIYNCTSSKLKSITMGYMIEMTQEISKSIPLDGMLWTIGISLTTNEMLHYFKVIFQHLLPAVFVDTLLWLCGRKPMLVKVQRRIYTADLALRYYAINQWLFDNTNFVALRSVIKQEDTSQFYYDLEKLNPISYFRQCCYGARKYLLNEKIEDLPKARVHFKRMDILDKVLRLLLKGLLIYWILTLGYEYVSKNYMQPSNDVVKIKIQ